MQQRPGKWQRRFIERMLSDAIVDCLETAWLDNKISLEDKHYYYQRFGFPSLRPRKYIITFPNPDTLKFLIRRRIKDVDIKLATLRQTREGVKPQNTDRLQALRDKNRLTPKM